MMLKKKKKKGKTGLSLSVTDVLMGGWVGAERWGVTCSGWVVVVLVVIEH